MSRNFFKQKVIIFFGYNGMNYHGLQNQKGSDVPTLEAKLYQALYDTNLVGKSTFGELHQTGWSRGARTDKGVHALCNAVSMKLWITSDLLKPAELEGIPKPYQDNQDNEQKEKEEIKPEGEKLQHEPAQQQQQQQQQKQTFDKFHDKYSIDMKKIVNLINSSLPNDMRAYSVKLVTQMFDVRKSARCRLYEYLCPLVVFQPYDDIVKGVKPTVEFRDQVFERLQKVIKKFEGSHNFHNYSRGLKAKDASAVRYIMKMESESIEYKGHYFFRFRLTGQSFVYHQIRKMIGMTIQLYQEDLPDGFIDNTFFNNQLRIMLAPAQGLFLYRIEFDAYSKKADIPQKLDYTEEDQAKMDEFRPIIEEHIFNQEIEHKVFSNWLKDLKEKGMQEESEGDQKDKEE